MKILIGLAAVAALNASAAQAQAHGRAAASANRTAARVDSIFARWRTRETPGCAVAAARGGVTLVSRAYGMADLEHDVANTPETVFEAGSVSKQITAAAVILLSHDGKLSLDDDVRRYVAEVPDYGTPVRIRHLLNHTSGLRDWGVVEEIAGWPRTTRTYTQAHVLDIVSRQRALNFAPGSQYLYSNTGYNLLAIIVQRVSGMPFSRFTRERIFQPLGMTHTEWRDDYARIVKNRAIAYETSDETGTRQQMPFENAHGNGGLLTTVGDLLRWDRNFATGQVGGPALIGELQRQGVLTSGRRIEYGQGVVVSRYHDVAEVSHSGATAAYRAWLAHYPDRGLTVALLCNAAEASPVALGHRVADLFLPAAAPVQPPTTVTVSAAELAPRAGVYRNVRTNEPIELTASPEGLATGESRLIPLSASRFRIGAGGPVMEFTAAPDMGFRVLAASGDTLTFERTAAWTPARPADFAGEYRSDEAEVSYTAAVENGTLVMHRRPDARIPLSPRYPDAFTTPEGWVLRFTRDSAGRVDGFGLWVDRVRGLRFTRVTP